MASNAFLVVFLFIMLLSSATPANIRARNQNQDLIAAIEEMQRANYFTFVMLINMSPPDTRLQGNVTFLMPNDRMLAKMVMPEGAVSGFLLQHSIPSPFLFGTLENFPTGTTIPSSLPNYMLRISNNGRKNFLVNNVKIISPNICVAGSSIRCHGIDGTLPEADISVNNSIVSPPSCTSSTGPSCRATPPVSFPPLSDNFSHTLTAPTPSGADSRPQKSGSSLWLSFDGSLNFAASLILSLAGMYF